MTFYPNDQRLAKTMLSWPIANRLFQVSMNSSSSSSIQQRYHNTNHRFSWNTSCYDVNSDDDHEDDDKNAGDDHDDDNQHHQHHCYDPSYAPLLLVYSAAPMLCYVYMYVVLCMCMCVCVCVMYVSMIVPPTTICPENGHALLMLSLGIVPWSARRINKPLRSWVICTNIVSKQSTV